MNPEISPPPLRHVFLEDAKVISRPQFTQGDEAPNLRDYWQVIRKHKWLIGICFVTADRPHPHRAVFHDTNLHGQCDPAD